MSEHQLLKGQKALVTGASSGIGRGIALALAKAGADVLVNYSSHEGEALEVVQEIEAMKRKAIAVKADVSQESDVLHMFERMQEEWGKIDILINNAGVQADASIDEMTLEEWNKVISINLTGQFLCTREAIKAFKRQPFDKNLSKARGKIIFISSVHEVIPWAHHANYAASKGGISLLMKSVAQEVAPERIRVNSISPGAIKTKINEEAWNTPEAERDLLQHIPYKRVGEPEDIGQAAAWLASDQADYITGASLFIDGGMTLYPEFSSGG